MLHQLSNNSSEGMMIDHFFSCRLKKKNTKQQHTKASKQQQQQQKQSKLNFNSLAPNFLIYFIPDKTLNSVYYLCQDHYRIKEGYDILNRVLKVITLDCPPPSLSCFFFFFTIL